MFGAPMSVPKGIATSSKGLVALIALMCLSAYMNMPTVSDANYNYISEWSRRLLEDDPNINPTARSHHKDLFPMDAADFWGTVLIGLGSMIAASGGIGGGGMLVPLLILIFEFSPKYAIPLSNFTIVGSSITNIVLNLVKRHPDVDRPLVDWDLILVMEPLTMVGAIVGAFMSKTLPDWLLSISLVILLAVTTEATLKKGIQQWNKESALFAEEEKGLVEQAHNKDIEMSETSGLLEEGEGEEEGKGPKAAPPAKRFEQLPRLAEKEKAGLEEEKKKKREEEKEKELKMTRLQRAVNDLERGANTAMNRGEEGEGDSDVDKTDAEIESSIRKTISDAGELESLLAQEARTPLDKMAIMTSMVVAVIVLNLLKGGKEGVFDSPLGIECGSMAYWGVQLAVVVLVLIVSVWARNVLLAKWRLKKRLKYEYAPGDVEWNERNTVVYPAMCFFAGLFAGMFGVGGGIVKGPLMLQMGVNPLVASATVAVMIMFTSVAATAMFIAFGTLKWDYAIFLFLIGLSTTAIGQFGVSYLVKLYRRISLVSLSIGLVVAISTLLMALQSILTLTSSEDTQEAQTDNKLCS